jgi:hypothetical protein
MALTFLSNNSKPNLIIFVHGFIGGKETWVRDDEAKSILDYLKEDTKINELFDFAVFDYYTTFTDKIGKTKGFFASLFGVKSEPTKNIDIQNISQMLKSEIQYIGRPLENIVLITHSMGGLVAKSMILEDIDKKQKSKISLYVSLAVPHKGSNIATLGQIIFGNPQIKNLEPLNEKINAMNDEWIRYPNLLPSTIYFQGKYDGIVPNTSSKGIDSRNIEIVYTDDDHTGIVRPKSKDDIVIRAIKKNLELLFEKKVINEQIETLATQIIPDDVFSLYENLRKGLSSPQENIAQIERIGNSNDPKKKTYLREVASFSYISYMEIDAIDLIISKIDKGEKSQNIRIQLREKEMKDIQNNLPDSKDPLFKPLMIACKYWRYANRKNHSSYNDVEKFIGIVLVKGFNDEALVLSKKLQKVFESAEKD